MSQSLEDEAMEYVLRPLIIVGGSVVITLLVGWLVDLLLRRADSRHHDTPLWVCCAGAGSPCSWCSAPRC